MKYEKVLNYSNLIRDPSTGAIINTDKVDITESKNIKNNLFNILNMQNEIDYLKGEILEIKNLLLEHITRHG